LAAGASAVGIPVDETLTGGHPTRGGRRFGLSWLGTLPFFGYVGLFLLLPTTLVAVGAFAQDGRPSLTNIRALTQDYIVTSFVNSIVLSAASALIGAVLGALLAYAVATGRPDGLLRRMTVALSGVLAQFGGVVLAFAFVATIGGEGLVTIFLRDHDLNLDPLWLFQVRGLILVYTYFQIPLMVLVFLPALDGVRPQWREATTTLGGTTWDYWRHVALPLLFPPFLGALLLLFANAFSAYATAAALVTQGGIVAPLQIQNAMTSETALGQANIGKAIALAMIVIVAIVMTAQALVQRRSSKWLR
jgi:putative spermidine/putrescine transport system permease protein